MSQMEQTIECSSLIHRDAWFALLARKGKDQEILFYLDLLENWKSVELKLVERLDELS